MFIGGRYIFKTVNKLNQTTGSKLERAIISLIRGLLFIICLGAHLSFPLGIYLTNVEPKILSYLGFVFLGIFIQIISCLFLLNTVNYLYQGCLYCRVAGTSDRPRPSGHTNTSIGPGIKNNLLTPKTRIVVTLLYGILVSSYATYCALQDPTPKQVVIPVNKLKASFDGFKIVQISDIHLGPTVGKSRFKKVVQQVNLFKPGTEHNMIMPIIYYVVNFIYLIILID